jgi:hypothetical protein
MSIPLLSEICRKNNFTYSTSIKKTGNHNYKNWNCVVYLYDHQAMLVASFRSEDFLMTKQEAIESAAQKAISSFGVAPKEERRERRRSISPESVRSRSPERTTTIPVYTKIYILDLENRPFHDRKKEKNSLYIGFIASTHATVNKYSDWQEMTTSNLIKESTKNNKLLYKAQGGVKELVDHFMTGFTSNVVDYVAFFGLQTRVCIVSADNSSWCTRLCLIQHAKWKGIEGMITVENKC